MTRSSLAAALLLLAASARAAAPERPLPEQEAKGIHGSQGYCPTAAYEMRIEVPGLPIFDDPHVPENWTQGARSAERDARERVISARRLTSRVQLEASNIVVAANECGDGLWASLSAFQSEAEGAARDVAAASLSAYLPHGEKLTTTSVAWRDHAEPWRPPETRYAGACRAPELDDVLFAPEGAGLPADARAKLAAIGETAATVSKALREEKKALDELLPLLEGARCREILTAFDALTDQQRRAFFAYREKAVAGAVWGGLKWTKVSP